MVAIQSNMLPLGIVAPDFSLYDSVTERIRSLQSLQGCRGTLIMFICNHCPYVLHISQQLVALAGEYSAAGIAVIAISANDVSQYPQDSPENMKALMSAWGNPFAAYLYDETQAVAKAYQAACTPDFYLFDAQLHCVYRGRLDGATPKNAIPVTGNELRQALDNLLANLPISEQQIPSIGCNIKWKAE